MNFRWAYYRRAAEHAGVPEADILDAIQDIAIRVWRADRDDVIVVRRAAIDAARRYGPRSRHGVSRETVPLDDVGASFPAPVADGIDLRRALAMAWRRLSRREREGMLMRVTKTPARTRADYYAANRAARKLRAALDPASARF